MSASPKHGRVRHRLHGNPFNIRGPIVVPDWRAVFGRDAPLALDIGFGAGRFTLDLAAQHPEWNVVGLEIRPHLVERLLKARALRGPRNLHAVLANANVHLTALFPERSIIFAALNFPDPWFKRRHAKRRVVHPEWVQMLASRLLPGAEFHAMTDYAPVALEIRDVFRAASGFENLNGAPDFASASTTGIVSERELAHLKRGTEIYRLGFRYGFL